MSARGPASPCSLLGYLEYYVDRQTKKLTFTTGSTHLLRRLKSLFAIEQSLRIATKDRQRTDQTKDLSYPGLCQFKMCVTNTTSRRPPAIALAPEMMANSSSMLSQRLYGNLFPTTETGNSACAGPVQAEQAVNNFGCGFYNGTISGNVSLDVNDDKPRPKRRRKPQKPGKTAKQNDRHFVVHNYHDHSHDIDDGDNDVEEEPHRRRGGVSIAFPLKLHAVLDQVEADGLAHVISWQPHGRAFVIHKPKEFTDHVMPKYFRQSKLTSFQRQLNLYGFSRLTRGGDAGGKSNLSVTMHLVHPVASLTSAFVDPFSLKATIMNASFVASNSCARQ
jgi:HSF-type DNA-binding